MIDNFLITDRLYTIEDFRKFPQLAKSTKPPKPNGLMPRTVAGALQDMRPGNTHFNALTVSKALVEQGVGLEEVRAVLDAKMDDKEDMEKILTSTVKRYGKQLNKPRPVYPYNAMGVFTDVCKAFSAATQVPIEGVFPAVLVSASACVAHLKDAENIMGSARPLSLYTCIVMDSGGRKSSLFEKVMKGIDRWEEQRNISYQSDLRKYEFDLHDYNSQKDSLKKKIAKEGITSQSGAYGDFLEISEPQPPKTPTLRISGDFSVAALGKATQHGRGSYLIAEDEGSQFFHGLSMDTKTIRHTWGVLNIYWDGKRPSDVRITRDGISSGKARINMMVGSQPCIFDPVIRNEGNKGQGVTARLLIEVPFDNRGTRLYEPEKVTEKHKIHMESFWQHQVHCLSYPPKMNDGEFAPDKLPLSDYAKKILVDFYNETEQTLLNENKDYGGEVAKIADIATRIGAVMSLWANPECDEIKADHIRNACQLAQYYLDMNIWAQENGVDPDRNREIANRIVGWFGNEPFYTAKLAKYMHKPVDEAKEVLNTLVEEDIIIILEENTIIDGSPRKECWQVSQ